MELSFLKLLNTSISASWLILAVIAARLLLRKAPKNLHCLLWALVAIRLICPFSVESGLSLVPSPETVPEIYLTLEGESRQYGAVLEVVGNSLYPQPVTVPVGASVDQVQVQDLFWTMIWMAGLGIMALYALISVLRVRRRVAASVREEGNVWLCDEIDTPFIFGLLVPKIYLPSGLGPEERVHVLAHERTHLRRKDHWWKPVGFGLLSVYWFNPLIWAAYILLCRDIELACDEAVIRDLDPEGRKSYSGALLNCSVRGRWIAACPLAFGEVGVKERIRKVLHYRRPAFWVMVLGVLVCAAVAVCFLTDPKSPEEQPEEIRTGPVQRLEPAGQTAYLGGANYNMSLEIPGDWEYEYRQEYDAMGIAFRPEGEEGWVAVRFCPDGLALCGTGMEETRISLGAYTACAIVYDGGNDWDYLLYENMPGSYVAVRENTQSWWPEYGDRVLEILSTAKLAQGMKTQAEIQEIAAEALRDEAADAVRNADPKVLTVMGDPLYMAHFHGDLGLWEVGLYFLIDSSPRAVVWLDSQGNAVNYEDWNLHLYPKNVTPCGMTLICDQYGLIPGDHIGSEMDLITGAPFWLEVWDGSRWQMQPALQEETVWTTEGWIINRNDTTQWNVDWSWLYGELDSGVYRIGKNVYKGNRPGEYAHQNYYAEFQIFDVNLGTVTVEP